MYNDRMQYFASYYNEANLFNPYRLGLFTFSRLVIFLEDIKLFENNYGAITVNKFINNTKIELKDFDKMPDSEALEIVWDILDKNIISAKASGGWFCMRVDRNTMVNVYLFENQMLLDEVRRRGYATIWRKYGIKQLIEKGWLILK